ncbi:DegV family protein [Acidiferrimicrobium sp. IK]|nr:DegV family protein [Acidiferrimicrobium sp. IK]
MVVPLWLTLGGEPVRDGELSLEEVLRRLDEGLTTSSPSPGEFAKAIAQADQGDGVLVLTLSAGMSSTYEAARLATELAEDSDVELLDTGTAAGAEGLVVLAAAEAAKAGGTLADVRTAAATAAAQVRLVATLPTLDHLARGGRVPGSAAWAGRWLGLNPIFEFRGGHVRPHRPARGQDAAADRLISMWAHSITKGARLHVVAMHASVPEAADRLLAAVRRRAEPSSEWIGSFSPVMVSHTGPGLVGLAWWWDRPGD